MKASTNGFTELIKTKLNDKEIFLDIENKEEYYKIETNGNLSVYDKLGYITTYVKKN